MKTSVCIICLWAACFGLGAQSLQAQNKDEGVVTYERVQYWTKIYARMTYLNQEEKDRMKLTWGSDDEWKLKMKLNFSPRASLYTYESEQGQTDDGTYSWRQDDFLIQRNFEQSRMTEIHEMLGKTYILEDSLAAPEWKILNQIKEVNGYLCMRAVSEDTTKKQKITAWFAQDIPVSAGPERYFGLPGLIMELDINEGDVVITATQLSFKKLDKETELPKLKGKKIDQKAYDLLLWKHIDDSIKARRNPFWAIRY